MEQRLAEPATIGRTYTNQESALLPRTYSSCKDFHQNVLTTHPEPNIQAASISDIAIRENHNGPSVLNGMILVVPVPHSRESDIHFGVKDTIGKRASMEDNYCISPNFIRLHISLECDKEVVPVHVKGLHSGSMAMVAECGSWAAGRDYMRRLYGSHLQCVCDGFHLFTLCDGHGGSTVSNYCAQNIERVLLQAFQKQPKQSCQKHISESDAFMHLSKSQDYSSVEESVMQDKLQGTNKRKLCDIAEKDASGWPSESKGEADLEDSDMSDDTVVGSPSHESINLLRDFSMKESNGNLGAKGINSCTQNPGFSVQGIADALVDAFETMDEELRRERLAEVQGTTMVVALVGTWHIGVASCGDSRGVLCRRNAAIRLTRDHKPHLPDEQARVRKQGGFVLDVKGCTRVNGILAMTRAIGDHTFKGITALPEVTVFHRHRDDEFMILASDGLWDVISDEEGCEVAQRCIARAESRGASPELAAKVAASVLMRAALNKGSCDNISVIVVDLRMPWSGGQQPPDSKRAKTDPGGGNPL